MHQFSARRVHPKRGGLFVILTWFILTFGLPLGAQESSATTDAPTDVVEQTGIDIDVVAGARRTLIPLAIPDVIEEGRVEEVATQVESILRRNFEISGYFQILPESSFFFDTTAEGITAGGINFSNWFNVGANGLIKSSIRQDGDDFALDLRLYSVEQGRQVPVNWEPQLVGSDGVRGAVNDFVNAVLEHYTGQEGIFGSRIAFAQRGARGVKHIYTMEIDGSNRRRISEFNGINLLPRFGPDGAIYFTSYRDGNPDLFVYRNGSLSKFSSYPGQNSGAAFCDGKLAVTLSRGSDTSNVFLINPQTGEVERQLTNNWAIDVSPSWSPDCSQIAFISGRSGGAHVYVMNADGSDQRRLTYRGSYNTTPDWSPRGDRIVFSGRDEFASYDVFTVDLEGNIERLTQDQGNNYEPSYSPDGRYILFTSDRGGQGKRIFLMTRDGQVQRPLTGGGESYEEPVWERRR